MLTTSRYASEETRKLARRLAEEKDELFVSRGKRTVDEIVGIARKQGEEFISIIEEIDGKPARISRISVSETGGWSWSGEESL
jgi:rRNA maturation protein Rpf1